MTRFPMMRLCLALATALVLVTGCDSSSPDEGGSLVLRPEISEDAAGEDISFSFSSDGFPVGQLTDVDCDCRIDLGPYLESQGFTKDDILSATLESARLVMLFPISEQLDFLDQAILKFEADGLSATEVANGGPFPAEREAALTVLPNRDVSGFLTRSDFRAILQIDAGALEPGEDYEVALVMTIRLELKGL